MSISPPTAMELKEFRAQMKLSQAKLGEALGASTRAVEEWEAGRRLPPAMLRLALAAVKAGLPPWGLYQPVEGRIVREGDN